MPDDVISTVGDVGWRGFRSRPDPLTLPEGVAAMAENMRFVRGRAEVRKGIKRLLDSVSAGTDPVSLPFVLGSDVAVSGITRSGATATAAAVAHGFTTGDQVNIRGADQAEYNGDFTVTVTGVDAFTYTVAGSPASPATGTIVANNGAEVRESYAGGIFGSTTFSSPSSTETGNGNEYIALFGSDKCILYRDGASVVVKTYPSGEVIEDADLLSFVQAFDKLFVFRGRPVTGSYARKSCTITSAAGTATVTSAGHGFTTGQRVCIEGAAQAAYNIEADITVTGVNAFTFAVSHAPVSPATGTITCRLVKAPLMWDGGSGNFVRYGGGSNAAGATYSTLRSTGVACYQNNQLMIAKTPVKDEVLVSDVLDPNTFDPLQLAFRANAGSNDYIVALHPFAEGVTLIFGRKSLYRAKIVMDYATGTSIDPTSSFIELITNEVGCAAANTIVSAGAFVFFLSDKGVFKLDTNYADLKVRGVTLPLSDGVNDIFDDITQSAARLSSAVWFDSRYWLSIPTGGSAEPNTLLIWNSLTDEWESVDSLTSQINRLIVSDYGDRRRLFASSRIGKLFLLDEREDGDDPASAAVSGTVNIPGRLVSRRYNGGDMLGKRWMKVVASLALPAGSSLAVGMNTYDLDNTLELGTVSNDGGGEEDYSVKMSARARGASAEVVFTNSGPGRPVIRTCQAEIAGSRPSAGARTEQ